MDTETDWRGGQMSLLTLAQGLATRGHRQTIVCPEESELARRAAAKGFPVAQTIARDADIVHSHSGRAHNDVIRATLGAKVRRVTTRHVAFAPKHPLIHRLKYGQTCDGIIAVSNAVRQMLTDSGIPASIIRVIHTGIEIPPRAPSPDERAGARVKYSLTRDQFAVGHLGAFTREKGQDIAVEAAQVLKASLPQAHWLLAGDGPEREELEADAPSTIQFPGFVSDRATFYSALDLFIMPSRSEAWGLAALEALAYAVPVIASDLGGLREIVEPGANGWLVPPDDAAALASAIQRAANLPTATLASMGTKGRTRAAMFSINTMVQQTEAFYRELLER